MDEGGNALVFVSLFRQGPLPERLPFTKFLIYRNYI